MGKPREIRKLSQSIVSPNKTSLIQKSSRSRISYLESWKWLSYLSCLVGTPISETVKKLLFTCQIKAYNRISSTHVIKPH